MIRSMTGFGKGEALVADRKITVEIRALNSKQMDLSVRIPGSLRQGEYELRNRIARALVRGKVDVSVTAESLAGTTPVHINKEVFAAYAGQVREACLDAKLDISCMGWDGAVLQAVLRLPEVVTSQDNAPREEELSALMRAADEAVARLDAFREQEGAVLAADLLRRVETIERLREEVTPYEVARTETVRARIRENLAQLSAEVDADRLEQEMIFYLEKLDITEEKVRLKNHCKYFREVAASEEAPGRKLGFIAQEMGREINTLGSKANESNIQRLVVQMKDELEKIKEQVLNLL